MIQEDNILPQKYTADMSREDCIAELERTCTKGAGTLQIRVRLLNHIHQNGWGDLIEPYKVNQRTKFRERYTRPMIVKMLSQYSEGCGIAKLPMNIVKTVYDRGWNELLTPYKKRKVFKVKKKVRTDRKETEKKKADEERRRFTAELIARRQEHVRAMREKIKINETKL